MQRIWKIHDYLREREERRRIPYGTQGYALARIGASIIVSWPQFQLPYRVLKGGVITFAANRLTRAWRFAITH